MVLSSSWRWAVLRCALVVLLALAVPCQSLWIPQVISSHMVLQRSPLRAQLWGQAAPQGLVVVIVDQSLFEVLVDATGWWRLELPAQPASVNHTLTIRGDNQSLALTDIAFGDVYLCSGQSNMEMTLGDAFTANESIADAVNYPLLRLLTVDRAPSLEPLNDTNSRWGTSGWQVSSAQYVNGSTWTYFSAVCFFFGRSLYQALVSTSTVVPIGLIDSSYGGTRIEAWTSQAGLEPCGPVGPVQVDVSHSSPTPSLSQFPPVSPSVRRGDEKWRRVHLIP